jgi:hypothetical protein
MPLTLLCACSCLCLLPVVHVACIDKVQLCSSFLSTCVFSLCWWTQSWMFWGESEALLGDNQEVRSHCHLAQTNCPV